MIRILGTAPREGQGVFFIPSSDLFLKPRYKDAVYMSLLMMNIRSISVIALWRGEFLTFRYLHVYDVYCSSC